MEYPHGGLLHSCKKSEEGLYILIWEVLQEVLENYTTVCNHGTSYVKRGVELEE